MNDMLPIVRQMHEADGDAARAAILLALPDLVLAKHAEVFAAACRRARFDGGEEFVFVRAAALRAVRDRMGNLPAETALHLAGLRKLMVAVAGVPLP